MGRSAGSSCEIPDHLFKTPSPLYARQTLEGDLPRGTSRSRNTGPPTPRAGGELIHGAEPRLLGHVGAWGQVGAEFPGPGRKHLGEAGNGEGVHGGHSQQAAPTGQRSPQAPAFSQLGVRIVLLYLTKHHTWCCGGVVQTQPHKRRGERTERWRGGGARLGREQVGDRRGRG